MITHVKGTLKNESQPIGLEILTDLILDSTVIFGLRIQLLVLKPDVEVTNNHIIDLIKGKIIVSRCATMIGSVKDRRQFIILDKTGCRVTFMKKMGTQMNMTFGMIEIFIKMFCTMGLNLYQIMAFPLQIGSVF